jgi:hypothetical protein
MTLRNIYDEEEEEKHWGAFRSLIKELPHSAETFEITFTPNGNGVSAHIFPDLFGNISGSGRTAADARENLLRKIAAQSPSP